MIKRLIALGTILIMLFTFASCGEKTEVETTTEVPSTTSYIREIKTNVAAVKDINGFGLSKLAADRDYAYTVTLYDDVQQVKELLKNGKADIAAMNIVDAIEFFNEGADIKIIAVNNLVSTYVLAKGVSISDPSGLKGKTIYSVETDEITEKFIKETLKKNNINYENLDIRMFATVSELAAEIEGKDKYVLMLDGVNASKLPDDNERKTVVDFTLGWISQRESLPVQSVVVARNDFISSNSDLIDEFRMFNEVSVNFISGNAESGAVQLYSDGKFETAKEAMSYIASYCTLSYVEKEKMQKVLGDTIEILLDGAVSAADISYIG